MKQYEYYDPVTATIVTCVSTGVWVRYRLIWRYVRQSWLERLPPVSGRSWIAGSVSQSSRIASKQSSPRYDPELSSHPIALVYIYMLASKAITSPHPNPNPMPSYYPTHNTRPGGCVTGSSGKQKAAVRAEPGTTKSCARGILTPRTSSTAGNDTLTIHNNCDLAVFVWAGDGGDKEVSIETRPEDASILHQEPCTHQSE